MPSNAKSITFAHLTYKMNGRVFHEHFDTNGAARERKAELCNNGAVEWVNVLPVVVR